LGGWGVWEVGWVLRVRVLCRGIDLVVVFGVCGGGGGRFGSGRAGVVGLCVGLVVVVVCGGLC